MLVDQACTGGRQRSGCGMNQRDGRGVWSHEQGITCHEGAAILAADWPQIEVPVECLGHEISGEARGQAAG